MPKVVRDEKIGAQAAGTTHAHLFGGLYAGSGATRRTSGPEMADGSGICALMAIGRPRPIVLIPRNTTGARVS